MGCPIHPYPGPRFTYPRTRLIINFYSRLWESPLKIATALNLAKPTMLQNWLTPDDARNLLDLSGYEVIRHWEEVLLPLPIPLFRRS